MPALLFLTAQKFADIIQLVHCPCLLLLVSFDVSASHTNENQENNFSVEQSP